MKNLLFILSLFICQLSYGQIDTTAINNIIQEKIDNENFQGTVLIAEKGNIIFQKNAGFSDETAKIKIDSKTKFGIASITKMITAILTLQLVEQEKIKLTDNLEELLPDVKIPKADKITVHHLLLHISGLPNEKDIVYLTKKTPNEFVESVIGKKKKLKNFGEYNYANIDYVLLGLIIEKYTNKTWEEVVTETFIEPLELNNTGFLVKGKYPENLAKTYSIDENGTFNKDPDFHIENFGASGAMYSDAIDLLKIEQAMYGDILLNEESKNLMYTSYPEYNYTGYSVWTYNYPFANSKPKIMERRGGIMGSNSVLIRFLETNKTIIILSNNNAFNPDSFGNKDNLREALIIELGK